MSSFTGRLNELLAIEAIEGLDSDEAIELESLLTKLTAMDRERYERAAAALHLATIDPAVRMPEHLRSRLIAEGEAYLKNRH